MSLLISLLIVWGALTTILVLLVIYRSTLTMHEEDHLFLDDCESHMQAEQDEVHRKVCKVNPWVRIFSAASGMLILVIAGIWLYQGITMR
jgi:hypothetical protein